MSSEPGTRGFVWSCDGQSDFMAEGNLIGLISCLININPYVIFASEMEESAYRITEQINLAGTFLEGNWFIYS